MKQHHATYRPAKADTPSYLRPLTKPVLGDSVEVVEIYYRERILSFTAMMEQLNVLEDAPEIEFLCRDIIECRQKIRQLRSPKDVSA